MRKAAILILALSFSALLFSGDWPNFRGPDLDNKCKETGLLAKWPKEGLKLKWKFEDCGNGFSSVSVSDGMIYTAGDFGSYCKVVALDINGNKKWEAVNSQAWSSSWEGSRSTPAVDDGIVYHMNAVGVVSAYKVSDGSPVWSVNVEETYDGKIGKWGYSESVIVADNKVICEPGGALGVIVALDKKTGAQIWACTGLKDIPSYSSATIATIAGIRQVVAFTGNNAVGINIETGKLLWSFKHETKPAVNAAVPLVYENLVVVSSGYGRGTECYKVDPKAGTAVKVWESTFDNHHGGIVEANGCIYGSGDRAAGWWCVDIKTGALNYVERGVGKGSVLLADGMLYTLSENGKLALVPVDTKEHKAASHFTLPKEGKGSFWAYPVVSNGVLYIRHDNFLYAYSVVGG